MNGKSHHKIQIVSKYKYHIFKEISVIFHPSDESGQRLQLILTKALQKSRHYLAAQRDEPYIQFSNKEAKLLGGCRHKENFNILIELGLLIPVIKYNYRNKNQSLMTFEPITLKPIRYNESITHPRIANSLECYYKAKKGDMTDVISRYLIPSLRKISFYMSEETFLYHVSNNYLVYCEEFNKDINNKKKKTLTHDKYIENSRFLFLKLQDFNNAKGVEIYDFISQDKFSGRFHTPVTILPKYLKIRDIIKYDGESMTELDIKTFQPMLLSIILDGTDYSRWYNSVDDCYLALMEQFNLPSRECAKDYMYGFVFGTKYGKKHKEFCRHFPEAGRILTEWKSNHIEDNPNSYKVAKNGKRRCNYHSNVSMLTQREEVRWMSKLWSILGKKVIPFVTIHDAILIPASKADLAEKLINERLLMWFKGKAELKRTDLRYESLLAAA